jgi:hypothetical protein
MLLARNDQKAPADRVLAPRKTVNLDEVDCVAESFDVLRPRTRLASLVRALSYSGADAVLAEDRRDRMRRGILVRTRNLILFFTYHYKSSG